MCDLQHGCRDSFKRERQIKQVNSHPEDIDTFTGHIDSFQLIHEGFLDFTIDQQPYVQGFYTVMQAFVFLSSGGLVGPAEINTGLKFVTKETVEPYLNTSTRFEGKTNKPQIVPMRGAIRS